MQSLVDKSRGLVLATHSFTLIEQLCTKLLVLDGGEQVYFGDVSGWDFQNRTTKTATHQLA